MASPRLTRVESGHETRHVSRETNGESSSTHRAYANHEHPRACANGEHQHRPQLSSARATFCRRHTIAPDKALACEQKNAPRAPAGPLQESAERRPQSDHSLNPTPAWKPASGCQLSAGGSVPNPSLQLPPTPLPPTRTNVEVTGSCRKAVQGQAPHTPHFPMSPPWANTPQGILHQCWSATCLLRCREAVQEPHRLQPGPRHLALSRPSCLTPSWPGPGPPHSCP